MTSSKQTKITGRYLELAMGIVTFVSIEKYEHLVNLSVPIV